MLLKIDAEGFEPQVIAGASKLLDSGQVALIVWERGQAFDDGSERAAMIDMVYGLTRRGFRHFRAPEGYWPEGYVVPYSPLDDYGGNVFSMGPGLAT